MPHSAPRFKGKTKREIADEAFRAIGVKATIQQVDAYFKKNYDITHCERSMYSAARRMALGKPEPVHRRYRRNKEDRDVVALVVRTRQLAYDLGGWDALEELVKALK